MAARTKKRAKKAARKARAASSARRGAARPRARAAKKNPARGKKATRTDTAPERAGVVYTDVLHQMRSRLLGRLQ